VQPAKERELLVVRQGATRVKDGVACDH
jgi:hypothetical protein